MKKLPLDIGTIHFVGIGGIGMSGLARILKDLDYDVQGSDLKESANTKMLNDIGIPVFTGHKATNIDKATVVVVSSAIPENNIEVQAARANRIPVLQRADMLAEIMRLKWSIGVAGTHGKTTTTSLTGALLESLDPTIINGGIINAYGTNTRFGSGDWLVAEADESDGTFTRLPCTIGIVTNIDPEHIDHYASEEEMVTAYRTFINNIPFYGLAILCLDHPVVQSLIPDLADKKIISYGLNRQADVHGHNLRYQPDGILFDVTFSGENKTTWKNLFLPMMGDHNVQNALASLAVAHRLGVKQSAVRQALNQFQGVKRRFTLVDDIDGVKIIDDYAHHPVEITATLQAARKANPNGQITAVMQPHRYSRLQGLFDDFCRCFDEADQVIVTPVYPAGEKPIKDINHDALVKGINKAGHKNVISCDDFNLLPDLISTDLKNGDLVLFMGAGDISPVAHSFPEQLRSSLSVKSNAA